MRNRILPLAALAILASWGSAQASARLNQSSAFLVYPSVQATDAAAGDDVETFLTITNTGDSSINAHMAFINGDSAAADYCFECNFNVPLTPNDTETLVLRPNATGGTEIENEDANLSKPEVDGENLTAFGGRTCPYEIGMVTAHAEATDAVGEPLTDNTLVGSEVVVNYTDGYAYSVPAVTFQGIGNPRNDRTFNFNDNRYSAFPRRIAGDFLAPTLNNEPDAELILFTLNFDVQHPPETDCALAGYDANEGEFSNSVIFGCWESYDLCDEFDPEFCYGNLGLNSESHTHGWFVLSCDVDRDPDDPSVDPRNGNVHGVLIQRAADRTVLRKGDPGDPPDLDGAAAWARLLYQSVTTGQNGTLELVNSGGPGGGLD